MQLSGVQVPCIISDLFPFIFPIGITRRKKKRKGEKEERMKDGGKGGMNETLTKWS